MAKPMPEYSMWKPAIISDSASSRSNGGCSASASEAMKKMSSEPGRMKPYQPSPTLKPKRWSDCACEICDMLMEPARSTAGSIESTSGIS